MARFEAVLALKQFCAGCSAFDVDNHIYVIVVALMGAWALHIFAVGSFPLTSTSRPPDVSHVMNETKPSPFFARALPTWCS